MWCGLREYGLILLHYGHLHAGIISEGLVFNVPMEHGSRGSFWIFGLCFVLFHGMHGLRVQLHEYMMRGRPAGAYCSDKENARAARVVLETCPSLRPRLLPWPTRSSRARTSREVVTFRVHMLNSRAARVVLDTCASRRPRLLPWSTRSSRARYSREVVTCRVHMSDSRALLTCYWMHNSRVVSLPLDNRYTDWKWT